MDLYFMRHGETEWNRLGLIQGTTDIPLNEYGRKLAEKTRDGLLKDGIRIEKIVSSPLHRAVETAEIIAGAYELPVNLDPRLHEISFGKYEGAKVCELRTRPEYHKLSKCFDDPVHYQPEEDAESFESVFDRAREFLEDQLLASDSVQKNKNVLVVCHGGMIRALICIIRKMPLSEFWTIGQPNCCVNKAVIENGRITMAEEKLLYYDPVIDPGRRFV